MDMRLTIGLLTVAGLAFADTLPTQSLFANASASCPGTPVCGSAFSFSAEQFDPGLGTLLSVDFSFADTQTVAWNVFGLDGTAGQQTIESNASSSLLPIAAAASSAYPVLPPCSPSPCSGVATNFLSASGTALSDAFIGTGTLPITFASSSVFGLFSGGGTFSHRITSIQDQASLQLTYTYAPIPEPTAKYSVAIAVLTIILARQFGQRRMPV
jgi:hypothetical protein